MQTLNCWSCGGDFPLDELVEYRWEPICLGCQEDHDAATAKSDAVEFQAASLEWYREVSPAAREAAFEKRNRARRAEDQRD